MNSFFTFTYVTVLAVAFRSPILFNKWFAVCIVSVTMWQYLELIMYLSYLVFSIACPYAIAWFYLTLIKSTDYQRYIFQKLQGVKRLCDQNFLILEWHEDFFEGYWNILTANNVRLSFVGWNISISNPLISGFLEYKQSLGGKCWLFRRVLL